MCQCFFAHARFLNAQHQDHESRSARRSRCFKREIALASWFEGHETRGRSEDFGRRSSLIFEMRSLNSGESPCSGTGPLWMHDKSRTIPHLGWKYVEYLKSDVASRRKTALCRSYRKLHFSLTSLSREAFSHLVVQDLLEIRKGSPPMTRTFENCRNCQSVIFGELPSIAPCKSFLMISEGRKLKAQSSNQEN